jgi:hypothetical protein
MLFNFSCAAIKSTALSAIDSVYQSLGSGFASASPCVKLFSCNKLKNHQDYIVPRDSAVTLASAFVVVVISVSTSAYILSISQYLELFFKMFI